ncbi:DUF1566 domain-containing protein [Enterovibrio norvegicus]|uniref:Lcl C-terminal domain-containing protein n=1 Tax=Enterovibrio norvegicus TaxID=188144 RepID=UPI0024B277CF|nr:DUF1566 domain-containing protein [Enterovibrio norvegicus]
MAKRFIKSILFLIIIAVVVSKMSDETPSPEFSRFMKVSAEGNMLKAWSGPWACIYDTETGLIWEVKRDDESIHDGYWTYSWYDYMVGEENLGDCYFEEDRCDTQDIITKTNSEKLCDIQGWRLPTKLEFESIIIEQDRENKAHTAVDYFSEIKNGDYWTSHSNEDLKGHFSYLKKGAISFNFYQKKFNYLPYRNAAFVMLVSDKTRQGKFLPNSQ